MTYSNSPQPNPYAHVPNPSPFPNIDFPTPYWINKLAMLIMIGCLDPDLAYAELLVPAALKMLWTVETPSTKQIIEGATGASWLCGTKQVMSGVQEGEEIVSSNSGRFVYGLAKGLDIMSYYAFMLSSGAKGVVDYASFAAKFLRICNGNNSKYRGITPDGGWPADTGGIMIGPQYFNSAGGTIGYQLLIPEGAIGVFVAWCSFSSLFGTGGVVTRMLFQDFDTGEILDEDVVDNLFNTSSYGVIRYFTSEGRSTRDRRIQFMVQFVESVTSRAVTVNGGCYARAWQPTAGDAPPYWNVKNMLKSSHAP